MMMSGDLFQTTCGVYKNLSLPGVLKCIIDTPEFQRLRGLKQLGVADFIYPSASHTRFQHSLGVAYLAGQLLKKLRRKEEGLMDDKDVLCVQIAALCHDLGHGPFSHMFEDFICKVGREKWHHEDASLKLVDRVKGHSNVTTTLHWLDEQDWTFIKEAIHMNFDHTNVTEQNWPCKGRGWEKAFLYDIVSNKMDGLDVDRFDYFMRDSLHCRVNIAFGWEEFIRLAQSARVLKDPHTQRNRICYAEKAMPSMEGAGSSRMNLFNRVYTHQTVGAIELMMVDMLEAANDYLNFATCNSSGVVRLSDCVYDMDAFVRVNDEIVGVINMSSDPNLHSARQILHRIQTRNLYFFVAELKQTPDEFDSRQFKQQFCDRMQLSLDQVAIKKKYVHCGKDKENPQASARFYKSKESKEGGVPVPFHVPSSGGLFAWTNYVLYLKLDIHESRKLSDKAGEVFKQLTVKNSLKHRSRKRQSYENIADLQRTPVAKTAAAIPEASLPRKVLFKE